MNITGRDHEPRKQAGSIAVDPGKVKRRTTGAVVLGGCATATVAIAVTIILSTSRSADATPAYAAQTGKSCADCHQSPQGGALTPYGDKFKENGHKLPTDAPK